MHGYSSFACRGLLIAGLLALDARSALAWAPTVPLSPTTTRRPEEFGTVSYTVTTLHAGSFTTETPTVTYPSLERSFGSAGDVGQVYSGHMYVGVEVPAGAIIDFIGLTTYDFYGGNNVATLFILDRYSGTTGGIASVTSSAHHNATPTTDYNASPLNLQLPMNAHVALVLDVYIPGGDDYTHTGLLRWVEVWWRRTVSPAPDTPSFADVPTGDSGYQFIEALRASGITGGCGDGTNFCPNGTLTRRQMAIFLSKALGLHWPD